MPGESEFRSSEGVQHVFATPIWTFFYPEAEAANPVLRAAILDAAQSYPSLGKSNVGGWRSRNDLLHWPQPEVKQLGAWFMECVVRIVTASAEPERYRGKLSAVGWASVCRTGNYNAPHIHPDSACSGVYYVDPGDDDSTHTLSGSLELLDPRPAAAGVHTPGDPYGHPVRITPRAGMLVFFPSWLTHWVHPHAGAHERIAISINVSATPENTPSPPS